MKDFKRFILFLGVAPAVFAQTGPDIDVNRNMIGEVQILKYINPANTIVNLANYKDWVTWGARDAYCTDGWGSAFHSAGNYSTRKIGGKIEGFSIQHCDEVRPTVGTTAFTWSDGHLFPKSAVNSKSGFYVHHWQLHFIPVVYGQKISIKAWLTTAPPRPAPTPMTGIQILYFPGKVDYQLSDPPSKENAYLFKWENNSSIRDHAYTINFTSPFTGMLAIKVGPETATSAEPIWLKALTVQDGHTNGVVTAGSYIATKFEPQYFIKFRNSEKVMRPDHFTGEWTNSPQPPSVKLYSQNTLDKNQMWYIHPSATPGYSNIWTKDGALTSGPWWWTTGSLVKPTLNDPWQQVQFLDRGGGYKTMRLGGKGPGGEDLYLFGSTNEGSDINVYFDMGLSDQEVQLIQANAPFPGVRYQVKYLHSGKCLTVAGASLSNGANIEQRTCTGANNQRLTLNTEPGGFYSLRFAHSGQMVDISGASLTDGANVLQWPYHGRDNQLFSLLDHKDGTFSFAYKHSGKCVDISGNSYSDGGNVIQWPCHYNANQRFQFVP